MRLIFAGTPEFAARALLALHTAGHEIALVLTQPDRPTGRGMKLAPAAVKVQAQQLGLPLFQPPSLKEAETQQRLRALGADAMVVAAYGLILPEPVLTAARLGALNIHASLLPRWRGAAPIQRAILAGDKQTGVCIMQMDRGLDTGPVLNLETTPIAADETSASLHDRLAELGAQLIVRALALLDRGELKPTPQDEAGATYANKISKTEAEIDWRESAVMIERRVRAFNPQPGAFSSFRGTGLKIWSARVVAAEGRPGVILEASPAGIVVACGAAALSLHELQRAGGKRLTAAQFLAGFPLAADERFECPA